MKIIRRLRPKQFESLKEMNAAKDIIREKVKKNELIEVWEFYLIRTRRISSWNLMVSGGQSNWRRKAKLYKEHKKLMPL